MRHFATAATIVLGGMELREETVYDQITKLAEQAPERVAIRQGVRSLSYGMLERRSNRVANALATHVTENKNIVTILEQSIELVEAMIGIMKAGCVFVPVDSSYPESRIKMLVEKVEASWIVTSSTHLDKLSKVFGEKICQMGVVLIDENPPALAASGIKLHYPRNYSEQKQQWERNIYSYICFTSGSTGTPKAILGKHESLKHFIDWEIKEFQIDENSVGSQLTSVTFDPFLRDVFVPLCAGGIVCIPENRELILTPLALKEWIRSNQITLIHLVPTLFRSLMEEVNDASDFPSLQYVFLAGELLRGQDVKKFFSIFEKTPQLINFYGASETTMIKAFYRIQPDDGNRLTIPIGKPIDSTKLLILNAKMQQCPPGIVGEVYIATPYISAGYYQEQELNEQSFIKNPFNDNPNDVIYKTGDKGRRLANGNFEIIGRADNQIKINGIRVEPEEIENKIISYHQIKQAVVAVHDDELGNRVLAAYIVSDVEVTANELRHHLSAKVPDYMIPSHVMRLEQLPLTANGKVNRKALPALKKAVSSVYVAPRNKTEHTLARIWSEILNRDKVGIDDNFFELGGHSLKATTLVAKIHQELKVELPLRELFKAPTISGISELILAAGESAPTRIEPAIEKADYAASSAQKRMWFLQELDHQSTGYNMPGVLIIEGRLDYQRLEAALGKLIERHDALRTSFALVDDQVVQRITPKVTFAVAYSESKAETMEAVINGFIRPFNLSQAPLLRVELVKVETTVGTNCSQASTVGADQHYLMLDLHHIIADGISLTILMRELVALYGGAELAPQRIGYKDFSHWQNRYLSSEKMKEQEQYWLKQLAGELPVLELPLDYKRPVVQDFAGASIEFKIAPKLTKELNNLAQATGTTLYMVLLSAINILLFKYSGQEDIIIGSPIAGRSQADLAGIIGMFVGTLAMRNYPEKGKTYVDFLSEIKETALLAYENQDYQFEDLVDRLALRRDTSRNPLFDVMFTLQNMEVSELEIAGLKFTQYNSGQAPARFDLTFAAAEIDEAIIFSIRYATSLFKQETIKGMVRHLEQMLAVIVENSTIQLGEIDMLPAAERNKLLYEFNDTHRPYPQGQTVVQLFEEQVKHSPNKIAVVAAEKQLTYEELNMRANGLAQKLKDFGVGADDFVAIMAESNVQVIIGILGILKAGGAYVPIDPTYPLERIQYMLNDCQPKALLIAGKQSRIKALLITGKQSKIKAAIPTIQLLDQDALVPACKNPGTVNQPNDLVYLIYTSGTTGKPKGVMVQHENLLNLVQWHLLNGSYSETTTVLQHFNYVFDGSVWEIFPVLLAGGTLEILSETGRYDPDKILTALPGKQLTLTPTLFKMLLDYAEEQHLLDQLHGFDRLYLAGEALPDNLISRYGKLPGNNISNIFNAYGPTEGTVCATVYRFAETAEKVLIGKPLANIQVYILNEEMLCGIGIPGELCISGAGLARGYLNQPELTKERFVDHPFIAGERMYRSGDWARWLPDGNLEFLGRIDQQVKLRGFRIELGEIENQLLQLAHVKEAVVTKAGSTSGETNEIIDEYLCAYLVSEVAISPSELKAQLSKVLPDYMIPSVFMQLENLPLTANGKIDHRALPKPEGGVETPYEAPRNSLETTLATIWGEVLGHEKVGIHDNFFDLGGHSLKATVVVSRIQKELKVTVPLRELFQRPTIVAVSQFIMKASKSEYQAIEPVPVKAFYETTSAQKRMWLLQQFDRTSIVYNLPGVLIIDGNLSKDRIEMAFSQLMMRHETLRTAFAINEGELSSQDARPFFEEQNHLIQKIAENVDFKIEYAEEPEVRIDDVIKEFIRPFTLTKAPLLRVALVKTALNRHYLLLDLHHIIADGISMAILTREFGLLYEGLKLDQQRIQYKDFAQWQNELLKSARLLAQEQYWLEQFSDPELPLLNLPFDYPRSANQSFAGARVNWQLDRDTTEKLHRLSKATGATLYMILLSAINILLAKYTAGEDILVGTPIAGRPHPDLENIIGMFVNTLVMRNYPQPTKSYAQFLNEVKENALRAYENQDYQFEALVSKLNLQRDLKRNPLFDVMFVMQNMEATHLEVAGLQFTPYNSSQSVAKLDLTLIAMEVQDQILFTVEYSTDLFKEETIRRLSAHLKHLIETITTNSSLKISDIDILLADERQQLLYEFNDTQRQYPHDKTVAQVFEEQVAKTPDNVAVVYKNQEMSYGELNDKSNQLAKLLRAKGVKSDHLVGVMMDCSLGMMVGILGILKAGGAYVPIDPEYPQERIDFILEDCEPIILITQSWLSDKFGFSNEKINLDMMDFLAHGDSLATRGERNGSNLEVVNTPTDLAYVIYTSGSTGQPKGVMVEHRSVVNLCSDQIRRYQIGAQDHVLKVSSISFDASVEQMFVTLLSGATLYLMDQEALLNTSQVNLFLQTKGITQIAAIPSFLESLDLEKVSSLKRVIFGGEPCKVTLASRLSEKFACYNEYGPTEATVTSLIYPLTSKAISDAMIPIGKPLANCQVYILNPENQLAPIGVAGELCIGGVGLARGYLNRPDLTAAKFTPNPFIEGERIYRTGDLARRLADGNLQFLGRIDQQVKIRGFRIELGEIESCLLGFASIKEALVMTKSEKELEDQYLCAYFVADEVISADELKQYLATKLPDYMIPAAFMQLAEMPLTPNGKVDKGALPEPDPLANQKPYVAPRNKTEAVLAKIWCEVLKKEDVGIYDNFFDLGGHSLRAAVMHAKIQKELNTTVPLRELFERPTILQLSQFITQASTSAYLAIEPIGEKEFYETSSAQKRMWLLQQIDPQSTGYNMPAILVIEGQLCPKRLELAFMELIARHETLRTTFDLLGDELIQRVAPTIDFKIEYSAATSETIAAVIKDFIRPFDFKVAPLLRVGFVKTTADKHFLLLDMHHIISDGTSMMILTRELIALYEGQELTKPRLQYKDFSHWQNEFLKSENLLEQERYWLEQFADEIPILNLPLDYPRPPVHSFNGASVSLELSRELTGKLRAIAKDTGATLYMVLLSVINILMSKYTNQEDIIIGSPIAGRSHADLENIIGMFVNTLAMRNYPTSTKSYDEFLNEVKEKALKAYENQDYQFEELVEKLNLDRDVSRNPLFDVMFILQNMEATNLTIDGLKISDYNSHQIPAKFDLTFTAVEGQDQIFINLSYGTKLFRHETIERMGEHLQNLLAVVTENIAIKIDEIHILAPGERQQLLEEFNDTYVAYRDEVTVHQLFEEQVAKTPNSVALIFGEERLTYRELNQKANQLAKALREHHVGADSIVAIMVERSSLMVMGILGILKAGAAYLPLDPEHPKERLAFILEDSRPQILLIPSWFEGQVPFKGKTINLDQVDVSEAEVVNLAAVNNPNHLACILYTSGSTGTPKGVMIEHKVIVNMLLEMERKCPLRHEDAYLLKTTYTFDVSASEIFGWFVGGGKLVILPPGAEKSPEKIWETMTRHHVTHINFVPTMLNTFMEVLKINNIDHLGKLKYLIAAGEALSGRTAKDFYASFDGPTIINIYGPTETNYSTFYALDPVTDYRTVPIGKPLGNYQIYILNASQQLVPVGVFGEVYISGAGLARGYLNRPELTAAKFVANPFAPGKKMYRTGDLARFLPDGNIEYLGRSDHQVKIRGFRIELGEIEEQLRQLTAVKEAAVLAREGEDGNKYLCAYLTLNKEVPVSELRESLSANLPEYMIPSFFIYLEQLPLTANGKLNRKALPEPQSEGVAGYVAPRNEIEATLAWIWSEVLGYDQVGIYDNFFDLGGHSLKAMVMISRIHKELNVELSLKDFLQRPTILGLSGCVNNAPRSIYAAIEPVGEQAFYEASSAVKRMWFLQQLEPQSIAYNMPDFLIIDGTLDKNRLNEVLAELIARHETLRTSFEMVEDQLVQKIAKEMDAEIEYLESAEETIDEITNDFIRPFDLSKAPLLRVRLVKVATNRYYLMFDMHHIISDGVSIMVLTQEFVKLYEGQQLKELRIQYKDFAHWQNELFKSKKLFKQEQYWLEQFADEVPTLSLPIDYPRPTTPSFKGSIVSFQINDELVAQLRVVAKATGATLYMILLSVVNILLFKYTNQEDIIVGTPIAGRPHADLEGIIGMFVNTLAMRNYPTNAKKYEEFLDEVKENALRAYQNQDYQFDDLIDKLSLQRDMSRHPLFDVMFVFQTLQLEELKMRELKTADYNSNLFPAKFDLTFIVAEAQAGISFTLGYRTDLFKPETIKRMAAHLQNLLAVIVADRTIKIGDVDLLAAAERHQILSEFNNTDQEYLSEATVVQLFEEQVAKTPQQVAVVFGEEQLTYQELNSSANGLAHKLRGLGVGADDYVAIMAERSLEMIIGIFGIIKAGGAYVPLDPTYPEARIKYMLEDCKPKVVVTYGATIETSLPVIDLGAGEIGAGMWENPEQINRAEDLIYCIYTSGTTGRPKGVMIEHRGVVNLVCWQRQVGNYTTATTVLQLLNYIFDGSVQEIFPSLLSGCTLEMVPKASQTDPQKLLPLISGKRVIMTPSLFKMLVDYATESGRIGELNSFERLYLGGEALPDDLIKSCHQPETVYNLYGPTEATVCATSYQFDQGHGKSLIGKPIANMQVYIVNGSTLCGIGIPGELCIAGVGLARGYLNQPELTREKFVDNPYGAGKLYLTGDLARFLPDGNIEYLGRIDEQVKIRGFRIELGEIEHQLLRLAHVKAAVVLAKEGAYLCAYLVSEVELSASELKEQLLKTLPEYMIPASFVQLEALPLTANGKVDKKSLPEPEDQAGAKYVAPRNPIEATLVRIWSGVLNKEDVGVHDNFFDLGGHSLKGAVLINKINAELDLIIPLAVFYERPYISQLASYIHSIKEKEAKNIEGLILLRENQQANENLFFVHSGSGRAAEYLKLVNHLDDTFNYWGINYEKQNAAGAEASLEKLALEYVDKIRKVQPQGPYYISGWSLGGVIVLEMARQLELLQEDVRFLGLYDATPLDDLGLREIGGVNWQYDLQGEVSSKISYFIAAKEGEAKRIKAWEKGRNIDFYSIDASHFSMFEDDEDVKKLALVLTEVLRQIPTK